MAVDLSTNSHAMKEAYNNIVQGHATNWYILHRRFISFVSRHIRGAIF
jgi:hypothetical protein